MKNITKKIFIYGSVLIFPVMSFAQQTVVTIPNPLKDKNATIMSIIVSLLNGVVMPIGAVLVVMYIIYAGFTFVTAQGKPAEIDKAKQRLLWALVGGAILLGAAAISKVVETTIKTLMA